MSIIVGYDGSEAAMAALQLARKRAITRGAQLDVVKSMARNRELAYEEIQKIEDHLERQVNEQLNADRLAYKIHLVISGRQPAEDLVEFAVCNNSDAIVIGIKKRSRAGKLLFGSTAQYVILNAPCPVVSTK